MPFPLNLPVAAVRAIDSALRRVEQEERRIKSQYGRGRRLKALLAFIQSSRSKVQSLREAPTRDRVAPEQSPSR